tara:strand:- start:158 stop:526 length:369 start_codon:yes stop_codon:yes gene_type:complete
MKKLLYIFSLILLLGCSKDEDTRIFTVTVNAIPPEGGTVTLGTSQLTTNEYKYGDTANANAVVSDGYFFSHWSANTFIHKTVGTTGFGAIGQNRLTQGVEMRCWDGRCVYDIVLNAHFIKKD